MSTDKTPQQMDPGTSRTTTSSTPHSERTCWAAQTLIAEVTDLFPETVHEVSGRNGRGVATSVEFLPSGEESDQALLIDLLSTVAVDPRVLTVQHDQIGGGVLVAFRPNARTQDSRDSFRLADALLVLDEHGETETDPASDLAALAEQTPATQTVFGQGGMLDTVIAGFPPADTEGSL